MSALKKSRKGSSLVLGSIMLVMVTLIAGILLYSYVSGSLDAMTSQFNTQIQHLLLQWATINSTKITAMLQNSGPKAISITNAYVNNIPVLLEQNLQINPSSVEAAYINGNYQKGTNYNVKLAGIFGLLLKFEVSY